MEFESMGNSSQTARHISKTIAVGRSNRGPLANTRFQRESFGSFRTSIVGASTADTLARFLTRLSNIDFGPYGRFRPKSLSHSASLPAIAALTSAIAWSGHLALIPVALLAPILLYKAQSRLDTYLTLFSYYLGASWPLIPGANVFFGVRGNIFQGILIFLSAASLLAIPAAVLFTRNRAKLPFAITGMFLLAALPPLGIIGWASPLVSAGVLFPGTTWVGLIGTLALIPLLVLSPMRTIALAAILALLANSFYKPPASPLGWQAIDTQFGGAGQGDPDFLSEFDAHERIQETINKSDAYVLLFPEHIVTEWNEATEAFWRASLENLTERRATLLIGVGLPRRHGPNFTVSRPYYNALIAKGYEHTTVYYQRIPVPVAMWKPFSAGGVPLNLFGSGTISVQGQRAAVLICYEQLLLWPFLSSAFERPTILITAANDYWARGTPIPKIQNASASSLARLFGLPLISAVNE